MNPKVIVGGMRIILIALIFLLPGFLLKITESASTEETGLDKVTAYAVASDFGSPQEGVLGTVKDSLSTIYPATHAFFYPVFFIGIITIIVGLRVD
ncbi:hypothetical protein KY347_00860 [Candidatus Woesearchaeota archaeon]|nr:hypothetical protein [Candidatus Woesearchaeota archaeon]